MRVVYRQSGGWANIVRGYEARIDALPRDEAEALETAIEKSGLLENDFDLVHSAPDATQYEIDIEAGGITHRARFDDRSKPTTFEALLRFLRPRSKPVTPW